MFRPSREEFEQPFCDYVRKIFKKHPDLPMFKVVPPKGWRPRKGPFPDLRTVNINVPIRQHAFGTKGAYRCVLVEQKAMTVAEFKLTAEEEGQRLGGVSRGPHGAAAQQAQAGGGLAAGRTTRSTSSCHSRPPPVVDVHWAAAKQDGEGGAAAPAVDPDAVDADAERVFWANLTLNPPLYGADTPTSFFDDKLSYGWNLRNLGDLLQQHNVDAVPGVTTPMTYFGMWRSFFGWHKEDADLYSVNFLHWGAPKVWYCVPPSAKDKFERMAKGLFPELHKACPAFVRHKDIMMSPSCLKMYGVPYTRACQRPNEFVVLNAAAYHAGFNAGFNCAEAVNFGLKEWIPVGKAAVPCRCKALKDVVRISMKLFDPKWVDPYATPEASGDTAGSEDEDEEEEAGGKGAKRRRKSAAAAKGRGRGRKGVQSDEEESEEEENGKSRGRRQSAKGKGKAAAADGKGAVAGRKRTQEEEEEEQERKAAKGKGKGSAAAKGVPASKRQKKAEEEGKDEGQGKAGGRRRGGSGNPDDHLEHEDKGAAKRKGGKEHPAAAGGGEHAHGEGCGCGADDYPDGAVLAVKPRSTVAAAAMALKARTNMRDQDVVAGMPMAIVGEDSAAGGSRRSGRRAGASPAGAAPAAPVAPCHPPGRFFYLVQKLQRPAENPGNVLLRWLKEGRDGLYRPVPGSVWEEPAGALLPVQTQPVVMETAAEAAEKEEAEREEQEAREQGRVVEGAASSSTSASSASDNGEGREGGKPPAEPEAWRLVTPREEILATPLRFQ